MNAKDLADKINRAEEGEAPFVTIRSAKVLAQAYLDLLEQNRWRPVSERLPKEDGWYQVKFSCPNTDGNATTVASWKNIEDGWVRLQEAYEYQIHDEYCFEDYGCKISHWKPLPNVPEE